MKSFLFTNTFFEEELVSNEIKTPLDFLNKHPVYLQLQYLSFLTASASETPLVSHPPSEAYLKNLESLGFSSDFALLSDFPIGNASLHSWGPSKSLSLWALHNDLEYKIPDLAFVKQVQSKQFCFEKCPKLPHSTVLLNLKDLDLWWNSFEGIKVLKTLYGSSGRGHFIGGPGDLAKASSFFQKQSNPVIGQPWVERVIDFSTQWKIEENGTYLYLGSTLCKNSLKGTYEQSVAGPEKKLFENYMDFFDEHLLHAKAMIQTLIAFGFFGNVGFDAFLYKDSYEVKLFPIVEINARKTMGWVALKLYEKLNPSGCLTLSYEPSLKHSEGLLPSSIQSKSFPRQLKVGFQERAK